MRSFDTLATRMDAAIYIEFILRRAPLFCDVSDETMQALSRQATPVTYEAGEFLFRAGERSNTLHVLIDGQVKLTAQQFDGRETVIELVQSVDSLPISAALTGKPYLLSAVAITSAKVLLIPSTLLRQLVAADPHMALMLIASLANQYQQMVRHVKELRTRTAAQRFGIYILQLLERVENQQTLTLPFVKKLIAARLNIAPESISRAITELRQAGVEIRESEVRISDLGQLRRFCQIDNILDQLNEDLLILCD